MQDNTDKEQTLNQESEAKRITVEDLKKVKGVETLWRGRIPIREDITVELPS